METDLRKCKLCNQMKIRRQDGVFPDGVNKIWRDENGLMWNGRLCGSCNQTRSKEVMRKKRG